MGATFMKFGRAPTTLIILSIDYVRSLFKNPGDDLILLQTEMPGDIAEDSSECAEFKGIMPRNC